MCVSYTTLRRNTETSSSPFKVRKYSWSNHVRTMQISVCYGILMKYLHRFECTYLSSQCTHLPVVVQQLKDKYQPSNYSKAQDQEGPLQNPRVFPRRPMTRMKLPPLTLLLSRNTRPSPVVGLPSAPDDAIGNICAIQNRIISLFCIALKFRERKIYIYNSPGPVHCHHF